MVWALGNLFRLLRKIREMTSVMASLVISTLFIVVIMLHAVNSDDSMDLIKESFQNEGIYTLVAYMFSIWGLALALIYIEKIMKFDQTLHTYKNISSTLNEVNNRISDAKNHINSKNKMNDFMDDIGSLSISKRKVYDIERKSAKTIVLSKELTADIQDKQLHKIILSKFRLGISDKGDLYSSKDIKYTWYTDRLEASGKIGMLMDSWYKYMVADPDFHLLDIWNARKYNINFKKIGGDDHLLIHDINIYNYGKAGASKVIGFIDQGLITHFVNLNADDDDLLHTLDVNNNKNKNITDAANENWEDFIISRISEKTLVELWRMH